MVYFSSRLPSPLHASRFRRRLEHSCHPQHRTEAIPTETPLRELMPFSASQPAVTTQPTVMERSKATQSATPTRPPALKRSFTTQPGASTRPPVFKRSLTTQPATTTRPAVLVRSLATQ